MLTINTQVKRETIRLWQQRWDNSTKRCLTYNYFLDVTNRLSASWMQITMSLRHWSAWSGHGNFSFKLKSFRQVESPLCRCGTTDTVEHLFTYPLFNEEKKLLNEKETRQDWPCDLGVLVIDSDNFKVFSNFVRTALKLKEGWNK